MKTFMKCLAEAATAKDMLIGDVLENWNAREEEAIIEKAAEIYAQQSNLHKPDVMPSLPIEQIISITIDETVDTVKGYVNEFLDSTSDDMKKDIEDLKIELAARFKGNGA